MVSCSLLLNTARMLFEIILLKFADHEFENADAFVDPLSLILFLFLVVFILMIMFTSIINNAFRSIRKELQHTLNEDEQILSLLLHKIKRLFRKQK